MIKAAKGAQTPVAVVVKSTAQGYEALAGMAQFRFDALLTGAERLSPSVREILMRRGYSLYYYEDSRLESPSTPSPAIPGRVSLLTSGSTGVPKLIHHTWTSLYTRVTRTGHSPRRWLLPYQVGTYAWYQIVTLGLCEPSTEIVPTHGLEPLNALELAAQCKADSISSTPTFWRVAFLGGAPETLRAAPFRWITLGGESVDQAILNALRSAYPKASINHVYASTEAGACIVVKDGLAGFPVSLLDNAEPGRPSLSIHEGRLLVKSPFSASAVDGSPQEWVDTGDVVEERDGRVYFKGRADVALINVGGNKAFPADVEAVLLEHPAIQWCRVRAVRAPIVGNLPQADIVLNAQASTVSDTELVAFCRGKLPEYAVPRFWHRLDRIPLEPSLKSSLS
jgi:acyl-coenzyme A synthetase/AMP-(fatty) acid ligase